MNRQELGKGGIRAFEERKEGRKKIQVVIIRHEMERDVSLLSFGFVVCYKRYVLACVFVDYCCLGRLSMSP